MDPFGWISGHCHVSSSQEEMLNTASYLLPNLDSASESEEDDEETVVIMMSVPETLGEEEFRTPPERHSNSLTSSNEARVHEDEEVDCVGNQENKDTEEEEEKTVDLSRDSEVFGSEFRLNTSSGALVDGDVRKLEEGRGVVRVVEKCVGEDTVKDDEDLVMKDGRVPFSDCCETRDVETVIEGNHGSSSNPEKLRTFEDAVLLRSSKDIVEDVERVTRTATLKDSSSNVRKLPRSFYAGNKGDGAPGDDRGVRTDKRNAGAETSQAVGANEQGTTGADDGTGKKHSEASEKEEPNENEQTENILKVLGLLAKPLRSVYREKVDIIGSAIKAGITFPRPSWWPEDSDDDSV